MAKATALSRLSPGKPLTNFLLLKWPNFLPANGLIFD